jgi:hypothetical protein
MDIIIKLIIDSLRIIAPIILISFVSLFFVKLLKINDFLEKVILVFIFNWVQVILPIEILSIFKAANVLSIYIFYSLEAVICIIFIIIKKMHFKINFLEIRQSFKNFYSGLELNKFLKIFFIVWLVIIIIVPLFVGIALHPPNYDSMTYHLARAGFWHQNNSINNYFTRYVHQNDYPVNAELGFLWIIIFTNSDLLTFLIQWLSFIMAILCLYKLLRTLGYSRNISFITTFIFSTFDLCILEASSTQNDMLVAVFVIFTLYFIIKAFNSINLELKYLIISGITTGIIIGTKGYSYLFIPGFLIFILLFGKNSKQKFIKIGYVLLFSIVGSILFASYTLIQNFIYYNNPLGYSGTIDQMRLTTFGIKPFISNFLKHIVSFYQKNMGFGFLSNQIQNNFNILHGKLNFDISSTDWSGYYFGIWEHRIDFDTSYFGLVFFFLGLPAIIYNLILYIILKLKKVNSGISIKYKNSLMITIIPILFFLGYVILFKWHIWAGRYMIAFVLLMMISVAEFFELVKLFKVKYLYYALTILVLFLCVWSSIYPMFKNEYASIADIIRNKINKAPQSQPSEVTAIDRMKKANETLESVLPGNSNIGIILDESDWVYIYFGKNFQRKLTYLTDKEWNNNSIKNIIKNDNYDALLINSTSRDFNSEHLLSFYSKFTDRTLFSADKNNFNKSFKPLNDCSFIFENNDILVKVTGSDPYFESTFPFNFSNYDTVILMIDLESKSTSDLQIFYGLKGSAYNENYSITSKIAPGNNKIYFEIPTKNLVSLRIDPIIKKEDIKINNIKIFNKAILDYKNIGNYYLFFKN